MSNFWKKILYALPFGMKSGDEIISKNILPNNVEIDSTLQKSNLGEDLLKGNISQEVQDLRFMDYKVSSESQKYQYIGDGKAVKKTSTHSSLKYHFIQDNKIICESVVNELNRLENYGKDDYTLKIITTDIPRFRLEKYCQYIKVDIDKDDIQLTMFFSKYPNSYDIGSKAFINELERMSSFKIHNHDLVDLTQVSFVTYKSNGEEDLIMYDFFELVFKDISQQEHGYEIKWDCKRYNRTNLVEKFYSESMDKKYSQKIEKSKTINPFQVPRIEKCQICGADVNMYDADIVKYSLGKVLCVSCLEKELLKNNEINDI